MSYYMMRVNRESYVDILVKADSEKEANEIIDKHFVHNVIDNEEFTDIMVDRERDTTECKNIFQTIEEYNRAPYLADFELEVQVNKKVDEPKYDLYLIFDESTCHVHRCVYQNLSMAEVLDYLYRYNERYILKRTPPLTDWGKSAAERGALIFCFRCEKRGA